MTTLHIFIDDSGQLNPKYPFSNFFVYAGFWCFEEDVKSISTFHKVLSRQIFHDTHEVKASKMSKKIKKQFIKRLLNKFYGSFHPLFESVYVPQLTIDFGDKKAVQLHKNYLIRRLVEKAIKEKRQYSPKIMVEKVVVSIDNQSQTTIGNYDSLERYINKKMHNEYFSSTYTISGAKFSAAFQDSKASRCIQICDILANSKYEYHNGTFPEFKDFCGQHGINAPLKLPKYWTTKSCK